MTLRRLVGSIVNGLGRLEDLVGTLRRENAELRRVNAELRAEHTRLEAENAELAAANARLRDEGFELRDSIANAETESAHWQDSYARLLASLRQALDEATAVVNAPRPVRRPPRQDRPSSGGPGPGPRAEPGPRPISGPGGPRPRPAREEPRPFGAGDFAGGPQPYRHPSASAAGLAVESDVEPTRIEPFAHAEPSAEPERLGQTAPLARPAPAAAQAQPAPSAPAGDGQRPVELIEQIDTLRDALRQIETARASVTTAHLERPAGTAANVPPEQFPASAATGERHATAATEPSPIASTLVSPTSGVVTEVVVSPFDRFAMVREFQDALRALPGIQGVRLRRFDKGVLALDVEYDGDPPLADWLASLPRFPAAVTEETPDKLVVRLAEGQDGP